LTPDQSHEFSIALQNRFQTLTDQDEHSIDTKWEQIRTSYHATCEENQSLEWQSPVYINFIDFKKAFDMVDRSTMWRIG